ncbi:hypothetical protein [Heliophilum fasciatum]|uniref:hypothetical protein n=1 Tax=Heliophilum fasciatum TaxID=35700 RepID=UPI0014047E00|nr:hypothetical protein [Heliophilum fasciatum]MCW2277761.1 hypothetical protein [Heliophilum fasciatum]
MIVLWATKSGESLASHLAASLKEWWRQKKADRELRWYRRQMIKRKARWKALAHEPTDE